MLFARIMSQLIFPKSNILIYLLFCNKADIDKLISMIKHDTAITIKEYCITDVLLPLYCSIIPKGVNPKKK